MANPPSPSSARTGGAAQPLAGKCDPAASGHAGGGGHDRRHFDAGLDPQQAPGRLFTLETLTGKSQEAPRCRPGWSNSTASPARFVRARCCCVGGDPGIGKSTLVTTATSLMAAGRPSRGVYFGRRAWPGAAARRAARLADAPVLSNSVEDIVSTLSEGTVRA